MDDITLRLLILILIPTLFLGFLVFYFTQRFFENQNKKMRLDYLQHTAKEVRPLRLQAYERMTLYLERIVPAKLIARTHSESNNSSDYLQLLTQQIEQEFEHNLAQQIYISDTCWSLIRTAKNTTINQLRNALTEDKETSGKDMRELLLYKLSNVEPPSYVALRFLKEEVIQYLNGN
ncbi:MAG: hypothetical protein RQ735_07255 [Flavobacteriaceae bacterium]|nr:hypothetical protein [Flavobacteriaceae bacterium]